MHIFYPFNSLIKPLMFFVIMCCSSVVLADLFVFDGFFLNAF